MSGHGRPIARAAAVLSTVGLLALCCLAPTATRGEKRRFYRVAQQDGVWWLVAPDGKRFFSLGVNVIDRGAPPDKYRPDRPEYAAFRHYPDEAAWAPATVRRLRAWSFNTLGGWCDLDGLAKAGEPRLPYTVGLWAGARVGVPWLDLFSDETARVFDENVRRQVLPLKDDPLLIGYYTDNELGWWDETIFLYHLQQPDNATRRVLLRLLRRHYGNDFALLRRDFDTGPASSFADLQRPAKLAMKPGGRGKEVVTAFTGLIAERYYRMARDAIRKYDPNHLILGDRYISWYPPVVAAAIRPYVDVVSTNVNADWTDGEINRFHFETLYRLTRKPILVTEYYMAAMENRSGNKNSGAGFPTVQTQRQRAGAFRRSLTAFASLPYVVGAHWFQYYDEPTHGRPDGEDFNMGLVDIQDRPYEELTAAAAAVQAGAPALHERARRAEVVRDQAETRIPPAPPAVREGLKGWDKQRAFVPTATRLPIADLYACWDRDHLYLAAHTGDYVDLKLYPNGVVPEKDRNEWTLRLEGSAEPITVLFGAGGGAAAKGPHAWVRDWSATTRFTAMLAVPARALKRPVLRPGDTVRFRAALRTHGDGGRMSWNGVLRLASRG